MIWRESDGLSWLEADLGGEATVAFSTRLGGVSSSEFESLNLGILTEDDRGDVIRNRHLLAGALGIDPAEVAMGRQVHGAALTWNGEDRPRHFARPGNDPPADADGQLTDLRGVPMLVLVADCLPVALLGERGLAMLHCGWRGLAGGIIPAAAAVIGARAAAVGPGIGPCCFEVGPEVESAFAGLGPGLMSGRNLDLPEVARRQLAAVGVAETESAGVCTYCDERFYSHRRDEGRTGRQSGIAWLN